MDINTLMRRIVLIIAIPLIPILIIALGIPQIYRMYMELWDKNFD